MSNIEQNVTNLIENNVVKLGYELYDVEYVKEGKDYFLRIYIDNENGISLDDCEKVSNEITEILDKADYIKDQYFLEVSSTGVEKILKKDKHLEKNLNTKVQLKLFKVFEGKKMIEGILKNFDSDYIYLETNEEVKIARKDIAQIKTVFDWNK